MNFRAAGLGGEIMNEYGMSVTVLPGGEILHALESGALDAAEFSLPTVDEQLGLQHVAKTYYLPGWHQLSTNQFRQVNLDVWNALEVTTKATIEMAGTVMSIAKAEALQGAAIRRLQASGVSVHAYSNDMLMEFYGTAKAVMERRSAENEMFGRVYASMMQFQEELAPKELGYLPGAWMNDFVYGVAR